MYQLRPYQKDAVERTITYFRRSRHPAVIVLPTGAGKSLVIAELARIAKGRVLVLAHVKELVEQNHAKYESYELHAGIYSAGLGVKECNHKVIFGSIQSVARAEDEFFHDFSLLIIDECHRVSAEADSQYGEVISKLSANNANLCILGLTATPYRLGMGWIYEYAAKGVLQSQEPRFFKECIYELALDEMIKNRYLTRPVKVDIPVTCYDFSELSESGRLYTQSEVEDLLKRQKRLTPLIIKNIINITESYQRQGVMIFSSTVRHATEIMKCLPVDQAELILGDTDNQKRDEIIARFKAKEIKYLVNVSVLTTGFDAPHVDVIAILRPTESVSLYQQIIGRGLRLSPGKDDCFILDYTGMGHNIFAPEIGERRPAKESVAVQVTCPQCSFENDFWGIVDEQGNLAEHFGRKCKGATQDYSSGAIVPCGFRFRYKVCNACGEENDITARECRNCDAILIDADSKLKEARLSKDMHVLTPDSVDLEEKYDRTGHPYLDVRYYDYDAEFFSEAHYFDNETSLKKFNINFLRSHLKRPELSAQIKTIDDVLDHSHLLRKPKFIIARKQGKFWKITEKIFSEEFS